MMEHHVLVHAGVGQLEGASFQSPEQAHSIQKDRVNVSLPSYSGGALEQTGCS